jgi:hypothetical protein
MQRGLETQLNVRQFRLIREFGDAAMDFFPVNCNFGRSSDADANLVPIDGRDGDRDGVVDNDLFANFAGQNQHDEILRDF